MSIHEEMRAAAQTILGEAATVSILNAAAASTTLQAVAQTTEHRESKAFPHGMGYLVDVRIWARHLLDAVSEPRS